MGNAQIRAGGSWKVGGLVGGLAKFQDVSWRGDGPVRMSGGGWWAQPRHNPHDPPCQALVSPKASHVGMLTTTSEGWERESVGWLFWKCDLDISRPHMWGFKTSQRRENNFIALVPRLVRSRP